MAVRSNIVGIDSPEALEKALRAAYYLADEGLATSAYLGLALGKAALGLDYKRFESHLEHAIHIRFGLPPTVPAALKRLIKQADHACAYFEATQLVGFSEAEARQFFGEPPEGYHLNIDPLPGQVARRQFVARFEALMNEVK